MTHDIPIEEFPVFLPATPDVPLAALVELVEINYRFAEAEDAGNQSAEYFEKLLSQRFTFIGARANESTDKTTFIKGLESRKDAGRRAHGLHLQLEHGAIAATILVTTRDNSQYLNTRLFEKDNDGAWVCVRWANVPAART